MTSPEGRLFCAADVSPTRTPVNQTSTERDAKCTGQLRPHPTPNDTALSTQRRRASTERCIFAHREYTAATGYSSTRSRCKHSCLHCGAQTPPSFYYEQLQSTHTERRSLTSAFILSGASTKQASVSLTVPQTKLTR